MIAYVGEGVEYREQQISFAGWNANEYSYFENQYGDFAENWDSIYLNTQQYHS